MDKNDIALSLRREITNSGITIHQMLALVEISTVLRKPGSEMARTGKIANEWKNKVRQVKELEKHLNFKIITTGDHSLAKVRPTDVSFTELGLDLLEVGTRFLDGLKVVADAGLNHGQLIRIASSTTLMHWLVSPSHPLMRDTLAEMHVPRSPEFGLNEIHRNEVELGLTSHAFDFVVLRHGNDLKPAWTGDHREASVRSMVSGWARMSNDEFKSEMEKEPFGNGHAHGRRRFALVLGSYDYITCIRRGRRQELVEQARRCRRNWREDLEVALCTSHPHFSTGLRQLESTAKIRVAVRTESWAQSAQMAKHAGYATVLPSIALRAIPELEALDAAKFSRMPEEVVLLFNPSILHSSIQRQMLHALSTSIAATLEHPILPAPDEADRGR